MSGIFKGDSIYKSGGGGGGFKNGGALVDGDFIAVDNNTISTYDNESRDPVNFYFDVKPGEVVNSVIEFTTQVNATINVYVVNSAGELVPIGNIGGNTVTAGESYNIVVVGNSFVLENITEPLNVDPVAFEFGGVLYGVKKISTRLWIDRALNFEMAGAVNNGLGVAGNKMYPLSAAATINNMLSGGWHVAELDDWIDLRDNSGYTVDDLKTTDYWKNAKNGNNSSGMYFYPTGEYQGENFYYLQGQYSYNISNTSPNIMCRIGNYSTTPGDSRRTFDVVTADPSWGATIRLCKVVS